MPGNPISMLIPTRRIEPWSEICPEAIVSIKDVPARLVKLIDNEIIIEPTQFHVKNIIGEHYSKYQMIYSQKDSYSG